MSGGNDSVRFTGEVRLASASGFSAELDGLRQESAVDPLPGGLVTRTVSAAGGIQRLDFRQDTWLDGAGLSADGVAAQAASARYAVTLGDRTVTLKAGAAGVSNGAEVAAGLAALLRHGAPVASLTGRALPGLPADGRTVALSYEGQSYTLRMTAGQLTVEGGEPGLLTASFDAANRLQVSAAGSLDGAGIVVEGRAAAAFGLAVADNSLVRLRGEPADPASLPASFGITVGATTSTLTAEAAGIALPAGFPSSAAWDAEGRLMLEIPAGAGALRVPPQAGPRAAGLNTDGAQVAVQDGGLVLTSTGAALVESGGKVVFAGNDGRTVAQLSESLRLATGLGGGEVFMAVRTSEGVHSLFDLAATIWRRPSRRRSAGRP